MLADHEEKFAKDAKFVNLIYIPRSTSSNLSLIFLNMSVV